MPTRLWSHPNISALTFPFKLLDRKTISDEGNKHFTSLKACMQSSNVGGACKEVADKHGERLLDVFNPIAVAMTLNQHEAKKVGHYMYTLRVTGPRVLEETDFGICCRRYHSPYITVNAAIGSTKEDIQSATSALEKALRHTRK
ncbi:hypothetical protein KAU87_02545 [Candidatus Bathyarchaeota archaeon]|nr:hypothetical protein [Candidatus Bathyarchaeota archaeon]